MKYFIKKYFFTLFIFFIGATTFAQTELKGKVADFLTFQPIESASVYIKNTTIGSITNADGNFVLKVPQQNLSDTLVISSIGYKSFKVVINEFENATDIFLEEDVASLDEVVIIADPRPTTGNGIVQKAIEKLPKNLPEQPYLQKGFLRHKERNKKEYKWLIESAITLYDSSYASGAKNNLKINVDETRKSYDLRDIDSLFTYSAYLKSIGSKGGGLSRSSVKTSSLIDAIKWNDSRVNGLENLFKGKLNLVRNSNVTGALLGKNILEKHQFELDTILVDNGRKLYKIKISKGADFVGLNTPNIYNEGFEAKGWIYIYYDNYAIKKVEYELVAASDVQKKRSKSLFDTQTIHKLVMTYIEYDGKMYPNYIYYETPKLVNTGDRSSDRVKTEAEPGFDKDEQYYYTIQEILFSDIIQDPELINQELQQNNWSADIFSSKAYNESFWKNYNVLLESKEEEKLIQDLSKRASLYKE
ncbi:carboxypeptidase-like regulatory domain-containing protein [Aequorivita lipolytica]|uniref:Carboxypeptidase-like regulatory domain-containing protein n=1 Tax=Aequorivita lipolytica TaxID=153267 RepID=A0A5C6YN81_9FLAO|nr:carboxypeptidase-like regulatory domain-containing protein [Aequorivita lipolytica]TXD69032.1 carboxypeptidase-like regulatory domain-containing protein [Aequorivita lipolytica]SRX52896.1 TonB-dependent receptor SusC [Aequorivita lipolytica]